jgi:outer membrane protein assembly factor BamB
VLVLLSACVSPSAAERLSSACPNPVGVAVVVTPSDPASALILAKEGWMVYALAADAKGETLLHQAAGAWDGRGLWISRWRGSIPLTAESADLVTGDVDEKEAKRVLAPVTGAAVDAAGKIRFRVPAPAGRDQWSHWLHGPDNNPVSNDTTFALPCRMAWLGLPINAATRSAAGRVAAGGRIFLATGVGDGGQDAGTPQMCELVCRSAYNGIILWRKHLPKGFRAARQIMIAGAERLLLAEGGAVLRLNAATGAELGRITVGGQLQIKWLVLTEGHLLALLGAPDAPSKGLFGEFQQKPAALVDGTLGHGSDLVSLEPATGNVVWRHRSPQPIDSRCIAASCGSLYYLAPKGRVAALKLDDGSQRWVQTDPALLAAIAGKRRCDTTVGIEDRPGLLATANVLFCALSDGTNLVALSARDGSRLWETPREGGRSMTTLAMPGKLFAGSLRYGGILNPLTGKVLGQFNGGGCGLITATQGLLFGNAGGATMDLATGASLPLMPLKTQCHVGGFVTDGRLIYLPAVCRCPVLTGCIALTKGVAVKDLPATNSAGRIEASSGKDAEIDIAPGDWPTHRANVKRSGATAVAVAGNLRVRWQAAPVHPFSTPQRGVLSDEVEHLPMPPVAAGGLVVVAATDGSVRAFDQASGDLRWTAWCEGPVNGTPTIAGGRVVVAAGDGAVYAFAAADGRRRWRYRLAPSPEIISLYGLPGSPWPANAPVVVENGVVYAVAGMPLSPGTTVAAIDLASGSARWATRQEWAPSAGLALVGGRLWARAFFTSAPAVRLDPATGVAETDPLPINGARGREIVQVSPGLLAYGAAEVHHAADDWGCARSETIGLMSLDAAGRPELPGIALGERSNLTPAGDGDLLVLAFGSGAETVHLQGWDTAKTTAYVREQSAKIDMAKLPAWRLTQIPDPRSGKEKEIPRRWGPLRLAARAVALARDGVVVTVSGEFNQYRQLQPGWKLLVLDRADGKTLQTVELPSEPAPDGLCLTRDGGAIVALRNGGVAYVGH